MSDRDEDIYEWLRKYHDTIVEQRMRDMSLRPHTLKCYDDPNDPTVYSRAADEIQRLREALDDRDN